MFYCIKVGCEGGGSSLHGHVIMMFRSEHFFSSLDLHHLGDSSDCPRGLSNSFNLQSVRVSVSHKNGKELLTSTPPPQKKKIATRELTFMSVLA